MTVQPLVLGGAMTLRALLRRRLTVAILVLLPVALYLASHDAVGRSVRSFVFGISWAVSTVEPDWPSLTFGHAGRAA